MDTKAKIFQNNPRIICKNAVEIGALAISARTLSDEMGNFEGLLHCGVRKGFLMNESEIKSSKCTRCCSDLTRNSRGEIVGKAEDCVVLNEL